MTIVSGSRPGLLIRIEWSFVENLARATAAAMHPFPDGDGRSLTPSSGMRQRVSGPSTWYSCDSTLPSAAFGGVANLARLWQNLANLLPDPT